VLCYACGERRRRRVGGRSTAAPTTCSPRLLGIDVTWAEADTVAALVRPETGLVLLETPQNPTLGQVDIAAVVASAGGVPVLVDNTFATPVLQNPARHGAALTLHSATKFLGGHGDVVAGAVACDTGWAGRLRQVRIVTGALLHPLAAYLLHRSLPTLPFRVREAQERTSAGRAARRPSGRRAVLYPTPTACGSMGPARRSPRSPAGGRQPRR
jgi:cystathionine beta-lyase/cystathionine gamma-synthase